MPSFTPYIATTAGTVACAVAGSIASDPNSLYYKSLKKPDWNPPNQVFPIAWTALYTDIAATSGLVLSQLKQRGRKKDARAYSIALATNLVLNALWSYTFFRSHNMGLAALHAGVLAVSSADLVRRTATVSTPAAAALAPYAGWTGFATALSTKFWQLNK